ncbi:MAG: prepilin-type N-terminal cleavage/methylation domain-containing protein [Verrucomicrobiota bacterium]
MKRRSRRLRRGFTLIEVILVVALGGVLLLSAASLVFGMFQLKVAVDSAPQQDEHIANLRRFLEYAFTQAKPINNTGEQGIDGGAANGDDDTAEPPVAWKNLPGTSDLNEMTLAFRLPGDVPLFVDDAQYLPAVDCYLVFEEGEGLYLHWQSDAMADEDTDDLRTTLLSPLVTKVEYYWYDAEDEDWEISEESEENDEGEETVPDFIRLTFVGDRDNPPTALLLLPPSDPEIPRL